MSRTNHARSPRDRRLRCLCGRLRCFMLGPTREIERHERAEWRQRRDLARLRNDRAEMP